LEEFGWSLASDEQPVVDRVSLRARGVGRRRRESNEKAENLAEYGISSGDREKSRNPIVFCGALFRSLTARNVAHDHSRCASGREIEGTSEEHAMEVRSCDLGGARRCSRSDVEDVVRRSSVCESVTSVMRGWRLLVSSRWCAAFIHFVCASLSLTRSHPPTTSTTTSSFPHQNPSPTTD